LLSLSNRIAQFRMRAQKFTYISYLFWNFVGSCLASRQNVLWRVDTSHHASVRFHEESWLIKGIGMSRRYIRDIFPLHTVIALSNEMSYANSTTSHIRRRAPFSLFPLSPLPPSPLPLSFSFYLMFIFFYFINVLFVFPIYLYFANRLSPYFILFHIIYSFHFLPL